MRPFDGDDVLRSERSPVPEPDAGNPHVRFNEREVNKRKRQEKKRQGPL